MTWSTEAWQQIAPIYEQITDLPFNQELMRGTLDQQKFIFYIRQDSLYLAEFGRALSLIAGRAPETDQVLAFIRFAEGAIIVERALHAGYFEKFAVMHSAGISPTCHHYTQFLLAQAALQPVEVAMAAVLPCFWIYQRVGEHIYRHQTKERNPYQDWINTYAGEEFGRAVQRAIALCDQVAETCTVRQRQAMTQAFLTASRMEWMFWESAWRLEEWPV